MKKGEGGGGNSKLGRWLGAPVRALSRACDSYVRKMSACAGRMPTQYAGAVGGRGGTAPGFMQAASFSSRTRRRGGSGGEGDQDDVGELVRAMSIQRREQQQQGSTGVGPAPAAPVPPRSWSVAAGKIDEDAPCEFGGPLLPPPAVRRTRSVAVGTGAVGAGALPPRPGGFRATKKQGGGLLHGAAS